MQLVAPAADEAPVGHEGHASAAKVLPFHIVFAAHAQPAAALVEFELAGHGVQPTPTLVKVFAPHTEHEVAPKFVTLQLRSAFCAYEATGPAEPAGQA